jgi:hypothetical protein
MTRITTAHRPSLQIQLKEERPMTDHIDTVIRALAKADSALQRDDLTTAIVQAGIAWRHLSRAVSKGDLGLPIRRLKTRRAGKNGMDTP